MRTLRHNDRCGQCVICNLVSVHSDLFCVHQSLHLLALDGEDARKHTLGQASAQDDDVVLGCDLVHDCGWLDVQVQAVVR